MPWAEPGSRFTLPVERLAIARRRGLARRQPAVVPPLGIDEKSFLKRPQYMSVVVDHDAARLLHVADGHRNFNRGGSTIGRLSGEYRARSPAAYAPTGGRRRAH